MINETEGILIEKYLDGALTGAELSDFETRLQQEEALADELAQRQSLHRFLQTQTEREKVQQTAEAIAQDHFKTNARIRPLWQRNIFRLASAAAAIALLLFFWQPSKPSSLYDQYAQHKAIALAERGNDQINPSDIEEAFAQKQFSTSIPLLQAYLQAYPNATEASLYLGICYLEQDQFQAAEAIFQNIYTGESRFKFEALWYLSLSAIKQKNETAAKANLSLIPEDSDRYQKAQNLLKKL